MIVLTQSEEGRHLRVTGCLYWMSRLLHAGSYVYDGTRVNQLMLPGPVPEVGERAACPDPSGERGSKPHRTKEWMG